MEKRYEFGNFIGFTFNPSTEEIANAKERLVEELCNEIRRLSKEYPDEFFITKDTSKIPFDNFVLTIGAKLIAPTLSIKE